MFELILKVDQGSRSYILGYGIWKALIPTQYINVIYQKSRHTQTFDTQVMKETTPLCFYLSLKIVLTFKSKQ